MCFKNNTGETRKTVHCQGSSRNRQPAGSGINKKSVIIILSVFIMIHFLFPVNATAVEIVHKKRGYFRAEEIKIGLLSHDVDNLWSRSRKENGMDINIEVVFSSCATFLQGMVHPNCGVTINNRGDTGKLYAGFIWEITSHKGLFFNTGMGGALHNGETDNGSPDKKQLGSKLLFRIPVEFGIIMANRHRFSIAFDHISNAGLASPNRGLDTLGIRYGYSF